MLKNKRWVWAAALAIFLTADVFLLLSVLTAPRSITSALLPTAEYLEQNPAPTPEFIFNHELLGSTISITVNQEPFARVGISADDISQHVFNHYQLKVDGNSLEGTAISVDLLTCIGDIKNPDTSKQSAGVAQQSLDLMSVTLNPASTSPASPSATSKA